jgi:hypothetical protein
LLVKGYFGNRKFCFEKQVLAMHLGKRGSLVRIYPFNNKLMNDNIIQRKKAITGSRAPM